MALGEAVLGDSVQRSLAIIGGPGESHYYPQVLCKFQPRPVFCRGAILHLILPL